MEPDGALHAYVRARLADGDGALALAVQSYRDALTADPGNIDIARRSYAQALESGDMALALRSAKLLDQQAMLSRDGTLLLICDALTRKDWPGAQDMTERLVTEGNFAFLAPIITSWIALGEGDYTQPTIVTDDRMSALAQRYIDEHVALQALSRGDVPTALPLIGKALAIRGSGVATMRLSFAKLLASRRAKTEALALLPEGDADYARARSDIGRGRRPSAKRTALDPAQGFGRLLARLAVDISADEAGTRLGVRLARMAVFADPNSEEVHIIAARLLTASGHARFAAQEARMIPVKNWYGALAQAELVDALAASDEMDAAVTLARQLAEEPGVERQLRLGRLLAGVKDYDGAAAAFKAAQAGYAVDNIPWALLLFEGSALEQGKRWEQAQAVLERAAKLAPDEPVVLNYLGYAQIERRQNVEAALALLQRASALKPNDASITDSLGWAHFVTGDVKAAVPVLERAAAAAPSDPTINEHLGDALWMAGRRFEARYAWAAAAPFAEGPAVERLAAKRRDGLTPDHAAP